jgi:hypothetical protein
MRETASQLLGPDDAPDFLPPGSAELDTLTRTLLDHLEVLLSDVEELAAARRKSIEQYCALACIGEARRKLSITPESDLLSRALHARRLARSVDALCTHYERLTRGSR